uniref:Uncharacterized protein n=1 Tax=Echeneis naucrates TaxID=173247 RepID=A0A665U0E3_ECHNA
MSARVYSTNMAACYVKAVGTTLRGLHLIPHRCLLTRSRKWSLPPAAQCRQLGVSSSEPRWRSSTEPQSSSSTSARRAEEEEAEEPEYIPKKKAKNPMKPVAYAWMIGLPIGIISFILAKREVDKNRLKQLKIRQRMRNSNEGSYEGSRYHQHTENVNVDQ